jgi:DNA-binding NtrC family response regulator
MEAQALRVRFEAAPSTGFAAGLFAAADPPDAVLIDLSPTDREKAVQWTRAAFPVARVVLIEAPDSTTRAPGGGLPSGPGSVRAGGEVEYPLRRDATGIRALIEDLAVRPGEGRARARDEREGIGVSSLDELVGRSVRFREALEIAMKAATDPASPVLITGEKGTGKRLFARAIHTESFGSDAGFVRVDCRTLGARELDSLFHIEGGGQAQWLSTQARPGGGRSGGTLFLEEVTALDGGRQKRLLGFLDAVVRAKVLRQGPDRPRLKVIAATAQNVDDRRAEGGISPDLLAKFSPYRIDLPPLRERPSDILLLAERFIGLRGTASGGRLPVLSREVQARLLSNVWPGNVRELFGVIEAALDEAGEATEITMDHLPDWMLEQKGAPTPAPDAEEAVVPGQGGGQPARISTGEGGLVVELPPEGVAFEVIEKAILETALRMSGNNVVRAARLLRLGRGSLRYRLEKYELVEPKRRRSAKRRPVVQTGDESQETLRRAS